MNLISVFFLITILFSHKALSQNVQMEYLVKINKKNDILSTEIKYFLVLQGYQSFYYNNHDDEEQFKYQKFVSEPKKIGELKMVKLDDNHYSYIKQDMFYKNYQEDTLIYNEIAANKRVIVGESATKLFEWTITPNADTTILNYKCQRAEATFRGREYVAYFCPTIANFGGPWKFDGLPGLILYVHSKDNYFVLSPTKIILNGEIGELSSPYSQEKQIITWAKLVQETKKMFERQLKRFKANADPGDEFSIKMDKIEDMGIGVMKVKK